MRARFWDDYRAGFEDLQSKLEFTKQEMVREFDARLEGEINVVFEADADIAWLKAVETTAP